MYNNIIEAERTTYKCKYYQNKLTICVLVLFWITKRILVNHSDISKRTK